ncbi:MAG: nucleotidyltransferase substrate binding protein [Planctomycetes bacterium]|nr:nucleotidyltransferase substrate binding protein [Planctomycetota bacterium]
MSNTDEVRWRQRFDNFQKAFLLLKDALEENPINEYSKLEQEGIIQRFEYTFELAWKTIKDKLFYEGYDEKTPRAVIRKAFEVGFISEDDTEIWLDSLDKRNILSHTYDEKKALEALEAIRDNYYPVIEQVYLNLKAEIDRK